MMTDNLLISFCESPWRQSDRFSPAALPLADRHYNRQTPGSNQFCPPGATCVLLAPDALWVTSWQKPEYVKHAWPGAWVNSLFRNEGGGLSSDLIRFAVAHTRDKWPETPDLGMVTFIDPTKVRHKRDPGRCYLKAGFHHAGWTAKGLRVLQLDVADMPEPMPVHSDQLVLL